MRKSLLEFEAIKNAVCRQGLDTHKLNNLGIEAQVANGDGNERFNGAKPTPQNGAFSPAICS